MAIREIFVTVGNGKSPFWAIDSSMGAVTRREETP